MDTNIIQSKALDLFLKRGEEVEHFWKTKSQIHIQRILATGKLIDGDPEYLETLVSTNNKTDFDLYNLYKFYSSHPQKRNYYKNGISNKKIINQVEKQKQVKKIAVFLPHAAWTGGVKMIFKLGDMLSEKGYDIDYFIPYNTTLEEHQLKIGPITKKVLTYDSDESISLFAADYEVAFATHWDLIFPLYRHFKKAVFYSQGDYDTFSNDPQKINKLKLFYSLPVFHMGVSSFISHLMENNYGRKAWIVPNGVNKQKFNYNPDSNKEDYLLVIGDSTNIFKNTKETIDNLIPIAEKHNMRIKWVTPNPGEYSHHLVDTIVNPEQNDLVRIIQLAEVYINGSLIEAFSLPPLEAMSCGTPVVASNNLGIQQYAVDNKNAMLFNFKNYDLMRKQVEQILTDKPTRKKLIENGLKTADLYEDEKINKDNFELIENEFIKNTYVISKPI
ncbi:glycosyltransferase family 4 protein [Bacillus mexicanus]|uniref:glycosyltransferase family 4 protein n=1 Tax=Bacillus mexicanus TaxID=2834415 RepID=UPI003D1AC8F4